MLVTRILLILLCLGVLSMVNGCYDEPSPYDNRLSYRGSGQQQTYREPLNEQEREYRRQRRAQERAYRERERERESQPDWLR